LVWKRKVRRRRIYNRLGINRCYKVRTTRRRGRDSEEDQQQHRRGRHPATRLPYDKASKLGVLLSSADAEQNDAGLFLGGKIYIIFEN
jgi:hypothetical protein